MPKSALNAACDVAIVGGGPAGLAAAVELKRRGVASVVVLEREAEAGGIPRHCGHPAFGIREFGRILGGPTYARRLVRRARDNGVSLRTSTTVVRTEPGGELCVTGPEGTQRLTARRVLLATGVREATRAARQVSGTRPLGVVNTGALQGLVYLNGEVPFARPVIVGTELVSFSALLTCRHAGIRPVAMIEENERPTAWRFSAGLPWLLGIPLLLSTRLVAISGDRRVDSVIVSDGAGERSIACDGVILTGEFTPESALLRISHIEIDAATGGPLVDQYGRCSDPAYYAAGNLLRAVETAGWSWREGQAVAAAIADDLHGDLPATTRRVRIRPQAPVRYAVPQIVSFPAGPPALAKLQLRVSTPAVGALALRDEARTIWSRPLKALPERRILSALDPTALASARGDLEIGIAEETPREAFSTRPVTPPPRHVEEEGRRS